MAMQYRCQRGGRWLLVKQHPTLTGIDYLEVSEDQHTLYLYFIPKTSDTIPLPVIDLKNITIKAGLEDVGIRIQTVTSDKNLNRYIITVDDGKGNHERIGDFSLYTLRLSGVQDIDPLFSSIDFSFKVNCPGTLDCRRSLSCPTDAASPPKIDYLSKDYASFRQMMLDRMSLLLPGWTERSPADAMVAVVEVLAYAADHLSYYQDAVATEAYLGTARKRISVKRHARLLDYHMHDGCNARTWVHIWWKGCDGITLKGPSNDPHSWHGGTKLLTRIDSMPVRIPDSRLDEALAENPVIFETMHDITLYNDHAEIPFYTWGESNCCLPRGATRATLDGSYPNLQKKKEDDGGYVLIFEEIFNPDNGSNVVNPTRRHAVRLTKVTIFRDNNSPLTDPLTGNLITEIEWEANDALPFPLCISIQGRTGISDNNRVSVARGNIVSVDHGRTILSENLGTVCGDVTYSPQLQCSPLTRQGFMKRKSGGGDEMELYDDHGPATSVFSWEMHNVSPAISLYDTNDTEKENPWVPVRDLLASDRFSREFVIEMEEDGGEWIRFGDDVTGMYPALQHSFNARYRVGNGTIGNIGHDTIAHIVVPDSYAGDKGTIRNPLPASGGTDPESLEKVRLDAPQAFRTQERAVTTDDYSEMAMRHPDVQKAVAIRRWTGSWYTVYVAIDRKGGKSVDVNFKDEMLAFLETYRLAGHDLEIVAPVFVPLDIELLVCIRPEYIATDIQQSLEIIFSSHILPDGTRGFFHPDNFTFGQSVYASSIITAAMQVPGVRWVQTPVLKRWDEVTLQISKDTIEIQSHEIARLDNDPSNISNGRIIFTMRGGI